MSPDPSIQPTQEHLDSMEYLHPRALAWVAQMEAKIAEKGEPLTEGAQRVASILGVADPSQIRVQTVEVIPPPTDRDLAHALAERDVLSTRTVGMTFGNGILLRREGASDMILAHELVHVEQFQRLGHSDFVREYILENLLHDYPNGPLEREAIRKSQAVLQGGADF